MLENFHVLLSSIEFIQIQHFEKILSGMLSECQSI